MEILLERLMRLWNQWQLRVFVLMSFSIQIVLTLFASCRKRTASQWVITLLWSAYLLADVMATTALGVLAKNQGNSGSGDHERHSPNLNNQLVAFWSPFLLLHLGGPDAITSFSLEDNELWLRHLLGLIVQLGLACYVILKTLVPGSQLWILAFPMFLAGIIKYGERTWALRSASMQHFRESVLPPPEPGPDYAQYMEEHSLEEAQKIGHMVRMVDRPDEAPSISHEAHNILHEAHRFFQIFRRLFFDAILGFHEISDSDSFFYSVSWEYAFKVIEMELQFMYDRLYTKASVIHTQIGSILRFISLSSIISVLVIFVFVVDKRGYLRIDIVITYVLLGGALTLEICQVVLLLLSYRSMIWLYEHRSHRPWALVYKVISFLQVAKEPAWSNSAAQCNLLSFCLKDKPTKIKRIQQFFHVKKMLDKYSSTTYKVVSNDLKIFIFLQLKQKLNEILIPQTSPFQVVEKCRTRGEWTLRRKNCHEKLGWSTVEIEFDHSIILWHIATDVSYHSDSDQAMTSETTSKCQASKALSDYLLYLLDKRPLFLPAGVGGIRFRDTCADTRRFLQKNPSILDEPQACKRLLSVNTEIRPTVNKEDGSKSVLYDACRLAKSLQQYEIGEKWEIISGVWVEMLSYAASQCKGIYHAQQLSVGGGEFLSRVWLLLAHFRMTEHYQIIMESTEEFRIKRRPQRTARKR